MEVLRQEAALALLKAAEARTTRKQLTFELGLHPVLYFEYSLGEFETNWFQSSTFCSTLNFHFGVEPPFESKVFS